MDDCITKTSFYCAQEFLLEGKVVFYWCCWRRKRLVMSREIAGEDELGRHEVQLCVKRK